MNRQLLLSPVLRSDHRYHDSAVSLCCSLPKQIHTSLAKIFTTDLNTFVQSVARINRNWKFLVVTLHVWVSRMWRQQLIFQTADTSGVDICTQRVISRSDVIVCRPSRQHKQGRWWWLCYKSMRLYRVFYHPWCFLTRTRSSARRCDEREIENST